MTGHRGINLHYFLTLQSFAGFWLLSKVEKSVSFFSYTSVYLFRMQRHPKNITGFDITKHHIYEVEIFILSISLLCNLEHCKHQYI